jgi:hypothetical protein
VLSLGSMTQDGGHRRQLTQGRDLSRVALEALAIDVFGDGELDRTSMQIDRLRADDNHDT